MWICPIDVWASPKFDRVAMKPMKNKRAEAHGGKGIYCKGSLLWSHARRLEPLWDPTYGIGHFQATGIVRSACR